MRAEEADIDLKFTFLFQLSAVRFSQKTQWKKIKRWDQETFQKNVHIEARADIERPISHFVFIGLLPFPFFFSEDTRIIGHKNSLSLISPLVVVRSY